MMRGALVRSMLIAVLGGLTDWAHAASPPRSQVPFVGCPSRGMADGSPIPAPQGPLRTVTVAASIAAQIAYYAGGDSPLGAYAPRGWHCRAWGGADGSFLIVTPEPPPDLNPHASITGSGVVASLSVGGTGGRFEVAQVAARFFPQALRAFVQKVRNEDEPASHFVVKPYPDDIVTRVGERVVEFTTPASRQGYGTSGVYPWFVITDQPVRGAVAISADPVRPAWQAWPNINEFEIRLPAKRGPLATALIQLEEQCLKDNAGC